MFHKSCQHQLFRWNFPGIEGRGEHKIVKEPFVNALKWTLCTIFQIILDSGPGRTPIIYIPLDEIAYNFSLVQFMSLLIKALVKENIIFPSMYQLYLLSMVPN